VPGGLGGRPALGCGMCGWIVVGCGWGRLPRMWRGVKSFLAGGEAWVVSSPVARLGERGGGVRFLAFLGAFCIQDIMDR